MIERFIHTALSNGIQDILDDPDLIDEIFTRNAALSEGERKSIKQYFADTPPVVRHQYAREGDQLPSYNIVLGGENEDRHFMGDYVGAAGELVLGGPDDPEFDPEDERAGDDLSGGVMASNYMILVYSEHPDITRYYYEIGKAILRLSDSYFRKAAPILEVEYSGGDLAPDPNYIPAHLFVRQIVLKATRMECVALPAPTEGGGRRFKRLAGLHVNDGVSPERKGFVSSGITPIEEVDDG